MGAVEVIIKTLPVILTDLESHWRISEKGMT